MLSTGAVCRSLYHSLYAVRIELSYRKVGDKPLNTCCSNLKLIWIMVSPEQTVYLLRDSPTAVVRAARPVSVSVFQSSVMPVTAESDRARAEPAGLLSPGEGESPDSMPSSIAQSPADPEATPSGGEATPTGASSSRAAAYLAQKVRQSAAARSRSTGPAAAAVGSAASLLRAASLIKRTASRIQLY